MKRTFVLTLALTLLCPLFLQAQNGTPSMLYSTWHGIPRQTRLYTPPNFRPGAPLVIVLHGTTIAPITAPPTLVYHYMGWDQISDGNQILVAQPIATWKPLPNKFGGAFFWESIGTESYFPVDPDDSGFLANLVTTLQQQYQTDPKRTFVMGFSSGGMMTQTMAIQHAELFAAAAPFSGTVWVNNPGTLTEPSQPISIIEFHGDADTTIPYCGGLFQGWGEKNIVIPSMDVDLNYWLAADGLPAESSPMCSSGVPAAPSFDSGPAKVEVQMVREYSFAHTWHQPEIAMAWAFFSTHGR
jgi:poly(3-hydroxybutyrate) depolymerase